MDFKIAATSLMLILLIVLSAIISVGQTGSINYGEIKVDELSDSQIRQLIQRAESFGYSDLQLEQMAIAQGMKTEEIEKLRVRVEKVRNESAPAGNLKTQNTSLKQSHERTYAEGMGAILKKQKLSATEKNASEAEGTLGELKSSIFGSELFKNGNLTFEPNLRMATPKDYIVGPDDELLIDLSGDSEASHRLKVSPDGAINMQYVGRILVGGLTIEQSASKIRSQMATTYKGLLNGRSQVAVNLGNIRSIKVTILGEIVKPGSYTLPSLATLFNALYAAGGPSQNGSYRNIQVIRNNKVITTIDVYNFLLNGLQNNNIRLQDQDVINVPVYEGRVEITGEVKRPAFFEVLTTESLADVLRFAGGFSDKAYTARIKVLQKTDREHKITDVEADNYPSYVPLNGDKFVVEPILDRYQNRVEINGAIFRPGVYQLDKGLTLKGLIDKADGIKEDAFVNRGYISRLNSNNSLSLLSFDLEKVLNGTHDDVSLQREDKVIISSIFDLREAYKVTIQGEVRAPGTFDYADDINLEALIQMAGGLKEGATPNRIEISRRIKNSDVTSASAPTAEVFTVYVDETLRLQDSAFILQPFDIVTIRNSGGYQIQKQVMVTGEVLHPGIYTITRKDERISDLIKRAGGLSPLAYVAGASLRRTGGQEIKAMDSLERAREERAKFVNLNRLNESGAKDTGSLDHDIQILRSDLVGINLEYILKKPISREDLILEDGDVIRIPRQLQTVRITGEVLQPNSIVYNRGRSFKSYINGAGGFSYNAYKKGAYIVYSNGSVEAARKFLFFNNYPEVKPGAEIFVPKRAEREKLTIQSWIGIGTAAASLGAIVVSLLR